MTSHPPPDDIAAKIAEDVRAWLECGCPVGGGPFRAYQAALAVVVTLREAMDDDDAPASVWAEWQRREDEVLGVMRVLERARAAIRMAIDEAGLTGGLSPGTVDASWRAAE